MAIVISKQRMIPVIIAFSFFMEAVDSTIINTAIPAMSRSLQVDPVDLKVALISYLLSLAIFIPISGWLADKFGAKKVFMTALTIFTLSSLWCGFSHDLMELIIARFIQGFGGALGLPVGRLILIRTFGQKNLITTMNQVITIGALGIMLGPLIGGVITTHFSWHWIFWINIPIGCLAILLANAWLDVTPPESVPPLDKIGFLLFGTALAGFSFGLSALSETSIDTMLSLSIILLSLLFLVAYVWHSHYQPHPIVKTELLRFRTFQIAVFSNLLCRLGFSGVPFLVSLLLQISLGCSAQLTGVILAPTAVGIILAKPIALRLLRRIGYKRLLIVNTIATGITIMLFALVNAHTSLVHIGLLTLIYGFMTATQFSAMNSLAFADIPQEHFSSATSIMGTLQQLSQSLGVAVSALCIRFYSSTLHANSVLTPTLFHHTFITIGCFTLMSTCLFLRLQPKDGHQMLT